MWIRDFILISLLTLYDWISPIFVTYIWIESKSDKASLHKNKITIITIIRKFHNSYILREKSISRIIQIYAYMNRILSFELVEKKKKNERARFRKFPRANLPFPAASCSIKSPQSNKIVPVYITKITRRNKGDIYIYTPWPIKRHSLYRPPRVIVARAEFICKHFI